MHPYECFDVMCQHTLNIGIMGMAASRINDAATSDLLSCTSTARLPWPHVLPRDHCGGHFGAGGNRVLD